MRRIAAIVLVGSLMASSAYAGDGALQPGKPAGVHNAQLAIGSTLVFVGIMTAVVTAIIVGTANESTPASVSAPATTRITTTTTTTA